MKVHVENGRIRKIEPHSDNQATTEGPCLKGLSYVERVHSPDRLLHPLRRKPGTRDFEPISWDEALDTIAGQLDHFRNEYGPQSVFFYAGSGTKGILNRVSASFWRLYGGYTTTYGDLCWPAGLEATRLTLGDNKHSAPWDLAKAKLIVMWGKNTAETNIHQTVFIDEALESGAELIVIDPRRTETAERAHLLVQPCPGTDGALAIAIANLLIQNGHIDRPFMDEHVLGFDELEESVREYTPEKASEITDVPAETIRRLAEDFGTIKPMTINAGFGMQRYCGSGQTMRAILALLAITGNIGKPGAGWKFANLASHIFDEVKDPVAFFPPEESDGVARVSISTARIGRAMLEQTDPPLKMLWVERGNPVTQNPDTHKVLEAIRGLDFRVVVEQFMTDTAREADIILPAKTMFEQTDVINAYWHDYIQIKQKVIDPPGEVKPETEIYRLLAERLAFPRDQVAEHFPGPSDSDIERYIEKHLERFPDLNLEKLKQGPILSPSHEEVAWSDYRFPTPSGKIELHSKEAEERWGVDALPSYKEPIESVRGSDKYSFYLMTPTTKDNIHSQFHNLTMIREVSSGLSVTIHPADAKEKGIQEGDRVRIFNDRGELELEARFDYGVKMGCLVVPNGWWIPDGGTVNFLSEGRETDMAHGAAFHENLVDIEKAGN
jgi:anaerobic selenocysteine-containing dehydrogenase